MYFPPFSAQFQDDVNEVVVLEVREKLHEIVIRHGSVQPEVPKLTCNGSVVASLTWFPEPFSPFGESWGGETWAQSSPPWSLPSPRPSARSTWQSLPFQGISLVHISWTYQIWRHLSEAVWLTSWWWGPSACLGSPRLCWPRLRLRVVLHSYCILTISSVMMSLNVGSQAWYYGNG